jgi:hypothetical protein
MTPSHVPLPCSSSLFRQGCSLRGPSGCQCIHWMTRASRFGKFGAEDLLELEPQDGKVKGWCRSSAQASVVRNRSYLSVRPGHSGLRWRVKKGLTDPIARYVECDFRYAGSSSLALDVSVSSSSVELHVDSPIRDRTRSPSVFKLSERRLYSFSTSYKSAMLRHISS